MVVPVRAPRKERNNWGVIGTSQCSLLTLAVKAISIQMKLEP